MGPAPLLDSHRAVQRHVRLLRRLDRRRPAGRPRDHGASGLPTYFLYPQAIAKLAGIAVILLRRWRTLTELAFAGFLYDLLLAWGAHVAEGDPDVWLASFGLVLWAAAYWQYRRRFPVPPLR